MALILPEVHSSGTWRLNSPFNNMLHADVWYTCIAVRNLKEYTTLGIDPYQQFYKTVYDLPKSKYEEDLSQGVCIITVQDATGQTYSFPSSYVSSFPSAGGVVYQALALAIDLGALPVSMDLTLLKRDVEAAVAKRVGITATAKLANLAPKSLIERTTHERLEAARKARMNNPDNIVVIKTVEAETLAKRLSDAQLYISQLENYIVSLQKR